MSYDLMGRPPRSRIVWGAALAACAFLLVLAATTGWAASRPTTVMIDGTSQQVAAGATVGSLAAANYKAEPGDLIAIDGTVAGVGGGQPPRVLRNGRPATRNERLHSGDVIVSRPGTDIRESLETTEVPIPYLTDYRGKGSLVEERVHGVPGILLVTRGAQSGVEVSSTVLKEPLDAVVQRFHPKPGAKIVALTFDDGPWPKSTGAILDILEQEQIPATFFMPGIRVSQDPQAVRRMVTEGHQVASHSLSHRSFRGAKTKEIKRQIEGGRTVLKKYSGIDTPWLRPPYGAMNSRAWRMARVEKSRIVMWDVDSRDWTKPGTLKIVTTVVKHTKPGSIVLMHDGGGNRRQTVKALPHIIRKLRAKGYTFVTVEELYLVQRAANRK